MDFATSVIPGWHTTIFPPYFVAGAIFSGFGMVVTLLTLVRIGFPKFKDYITIDLSAKRAVWRGTATGVLPPSQDQVKGVVDSVIKDMFARIPTAP